MQPYDVVPVLEGDGKGFVVINERGRPVSQIYPEHVGAMGEAQTRNNDIEAALKRIARMRANGKT